MKQEQQKIQKKKYDNRTNSKAYDVIHEIQQVVECLFIYSRTLAENEAEGIEDAEKETVAKKQ